MYDFKIGDTVLVCHSSGYYERTSIKKIAKVLKKYVVLNDDTKWNFHGDKCGDRSGDIYSFSTIKPISGDELVSFREKKKLDNKQYKIIAHVSEWKNKKDISPEIINAIYDILFPSMPENKEGIKQ